MASIIGGQAANFRLILRWLRRACSRRISTWPAPRRVVRAAELHRLDRSAFHLGTADRRHCRLSRFLAPVALWVMSALRKVRRSQLRRNAFVSSALNNLSQGVVMTDAQKRIVFCNDRYLEIYGLTRADIRKDMTGLELLALRRKRGVLDLSTADFYRVPAPPKAHHRNARRAIDLVKFWRLPNGGSVATHEDCSEQRRLSRQLATTTQFLESVIDNVPVCVAAKSIEDGRYILANRAFEKFSRLSRENIVGKRADEIFQPATATRCGCRPAALIARQPMPQRNAGRARFA